MRRTLALFLSLALLPACGGGSVEVNWPTVQTGGGSLPFVATGSWSGETVVVNHTRLLLDAGNGEVRIVAVPDAGEVTVEAALRVESSTAADARRGLEDLEVRLTDAGDEVHLETVPPGGPAGRRYRVDYTVTLPADLAVEVAGENGSVSVEGMAAPVRIEMVNGEVVLDGQRARASVSLGSGDIAAGVSLPPGESVALTADVGSIALRVPESTDAALTAASALGRIRVSGLDIEEEVRLPGRLTGRLGAGTGSIDLRVTGVGDIRLEGGE